MDIDRHYLDKLDRVARAPDDSFPDILWDPLCTDFENDHYFLMDLESSGNVAVQVDPRFTYGYIAKIHTKTKDIAQWLDWIDVYDNYIDYLTQKYGSIDVVEDMIEAGTFEEPVLRNFRIRPKLKKGDLADMVKAGIMPSFFAAGEGDMKMAVQQMRYMGDVIDPVDVTGQEEPDPNYEPEEDKDRKDMIASAVERLKRMDRLEAFARGTRGVSSILENTWVDHYYGSMVMGSYDTMYSSASQDNLSLVAQMQRQYDEDHMPDSVRADLARRKASGHESDLYFDGATVRRHNDDYELLSVIAQVTGINMLEKMSGAGVDKKAVKAIRAGMQSAGYDMPMTEKELKKMRKKTEAHEKKMERMMRSDRTLSQILLSSRLLMNGGTRRFDGED